MDTNTYEYIEGRRATLEALRSGVTFHCVLMADNIKRDSLVQDIMRKCKQRQVNVKTISKKRIDEITQTPAHQGVIGCAQSFEYSNVRAIASAAETYSSTHNGRALVVVLDHITDAGNLGAIIRSANAVGASGVIIPSKRSALVTAATYKTSAGAVAHTPVARVSNINDALERLKKEGFWIAAASEQSDGFIWNTNLHGKIALVMGNENEGVSRLVLQNCDFSVALPMEGEIASLNVAQAFTACAYEWLRQNNVQSSAQTTPQTTRQNSAQGSA